MDKYKLRLEIFWGNEIAREKRKRADLEAENKKMRECLKLYADKGSWFDIRRLGSCDNKQAFISQHGYIHAQKCLDKSEPKK